MYCVEGEEIGQMLKLLLKKMIPPSTSMMDARLAELRQENERLYNDLARKCSELSDALRYIHSDICEQELTSNALQVTTLPFILSVATYAPRFDSIAKVFRALNNQRVRPLETHIWIPRSDAPEGMASLPHATLSAFLEWGGFFIG